MLCENPEGWDGVVGGIFKREGTYIYIYLWLIYIVIWQKPTQHYKVIILQLKIKFKKRINYTSNHLCEQRGVVVKGGH